MSGPPNGFPAGPPSGRSALRVVGASVLGPAHVRDGLPNQDALAWFPESGSGDRLVVAVSDGHGARLHFRSQTGSALAVATAVREGAERLPAFDPGGDPALDPEEFLAPMAEAVVRAWTALVLADVERRPFQEEELAAVDEHMGPGFRGEVEERPEVAYGATLLIALVAGPTAFFLQVGDGDILVTSAAGTVLPVPGDDRLQGGATTSLCLPGAEQDFRYGLWRPAEPIPAVALLATDGLKNAFIDDEGFLEVGAGVREVVGKEGLAALGEMLPGWLSDAGAHSGDDATAAAVAL
ncbi:MAG TPA: PP2C family serine/threonine-protein phosphatase [Actinomycetota bacterium]|nr:PP2C family serine/threonine-protein phosphatase [Actinomycetota bacterium]